MSPSEQSPSGFQSHGVQNTHKNVSGCTWALSVFPWLVQIADDLVHLVREYKGKVKKGIM